MIAALSGSNSTFLHITEVSVIFQRHWCIRGVKNNNSYKDMSHTYIHVTFLHTGVTLLHTDVTILHDEVTSLQTNKRFLHIYVTF